MYPSAVKSIQMWVFFYDMKFYIINIPFREMNQSLSLDTQSSYSIAWTPVFSILIAWRNKSYRSPPLGSRSLHGQERQCVTLLDNSSALSFLIFLRHSSLSYKMSVILFSQFVGS